jgi:hypothetical protein
MTDPKPKLDPKPQEVNIRITRDPKGGLDVRITTDDEAEKRKRESKNPGKRRLCD